MVAPPVLLLALFLWPSGETADPAPEPLSKTPAAPAGPSVPRPSNAGEAPIRAATPAGPGDGLRAVAGGRAAAGTKCWKGDVYEVDEDGDVLDKVLECGAQLCRDARCLEADPAGCALPAEGVCDGDAIELCFAGRPRRIQCPDGQRCRIGADGAVCAVVSADACDWFGGVCEGSELVRCVHGELERTDCAGPDGTGRCVETDTARCLEVSFLEPEELDATCGGCGCESEGPTGAEVCDGIDNDGNDFIDDGVVCEPVPVVAFLVEDPVRGGSYDEAEIEAEIARVNLLLGGPESQLPLLFELSEVRTIESAAYLDLDESEFRELLQSGVHRLERDDFYVPIVFTDEVIVGSAPKLGVATLPNGRCGRLRRDRRAQVPLGLIAVSKSRSPTTVAHELGHFLGLCHTHEPTGGVPVPVVVEAGADTGRACPVCATDGDGMCDTPRDPGPPVCKYDQTCGVACEGEDAEPDATNLMSYYTRCRSQITVEQAAEMRRNVALRRGWAPCLGGGCACEPLGPNVCPPEMSCRPRRGGTTACALHGGIVGGEPCRGEGDCVAGHLCVGFNGGPTSCRRYCQGDTSTCDCRPVGGLGVSVCR